MIAVPEPPTDLLDRLLDQYGDRDPRATDRERELAAALLECRRERKEAHHA